MTGAAGFRMFTDLPGIHLLLLGIGVFAPSIKQAVEGVGSNGMSEGLLLLALAIGYFFVAINLFRLKESTGRIMAIVFSVIVALHSAYLINTGEGSDIWHVIYIGFNAWVIYYLCKASIRKSFALANGSSGPASVS
jgi:hypothetical protein